MLFGGIHPNPDGRLHRALSRRFPFAIHYEVRGDVTTVVAFSTVDPASITHWATRT
jgi:hypothetical protein